MTTITEMLGGGQVAEGMVASASLTGPSALLGAAGGAAISGVKALLQTSTSKIPLFDIQTGIKDAIPSTKINSPDTYILLHRGSELDPTKFAINNSGASPVLLYNGQPFDDGV
jgi:hypothetical protein